MNIVLFAESDDPSHSAVVRNVLALADAYRQAGHHVMMIVPERSGEPPSGETDTIRLPASSAFDDTDVAVVTPWSNAQTERLDAFQPSIVHSHHPFVLAAAAVRLAARHSIPLVFTCHTRYELDSQFISGDWPSLRRLAAELSIGYCRLADAVFAPNAAVNVFLHNRRVETPIEIVPSGINLAPFRDAHRETARQRWQVPANAFVLGYSGQLPDGTHSRLLRKTLYDFLAKDSTFHFLHIGDQAQQEQLPESLRKMAERGRVQFVSAANSVELATAYAAMDVLLLPSRTILHSIEAIEAMAVGVPVLAFDSPGARELIHNGENGWLLRSDRKDRWISALQKIAAAPRAVREKWSERARATAADFSVEFEAAQSLTLFANLVKSTRLPKFQETSLWDDARRRMAVEWRLWRNRGRALGISLTRGRYPSRVPVFRHIVRGWRTFRHWVSRREWSVKLLNLPVWEGTSDEPGLILLQIDGLSRNQFETAVRRGQMPFLRRLLKREFYRIHTLYPGQPTTTPAVLAELFYGVKQAVPSFGFRDHRTGQEVRMYQPSVAAQIQHEVARQGEGLLSEGSAYSDIYSGGAEESSFCASTTGWRHFEDISVWRRIALFLMNVMSLVRIAGLSFFELIVASIQCARGIYRGREAMRELLYVPRRVIVNIVLRELIAISVEADATRGVPVVHANFLGYDENAHHRGPGSRFAHLALRGIDHAIHRIWNAAHASQRREYHVWIMSDHGQEKVQPYSIPEGRSIQDAVNEIFRSVEHIPPHQAQPGKGKHSRPLELESASWLRSKGYDDVMFEDRIAEPQQALQPTTIAVGPLGYINWPTPLDAEKTMAVAERLVSEAHIPIVMAPIDETVWAWTSQGRFRMPDEAEKILAPNHPHLPEVAEDLTALCFHPDGGNFVVCGWRNDGPPLSFVTEYGAHGGPGPEESSGFFVVPPDAPLPQSDNGIFRPLTLRRMAQTVLRRVTPERTRRDTELRNGSSVRVATYNVHSCIGLDGRLSPTRIARVLAAATPDIIALQEVDVLRDRTRFVHQAEQIARALSMELHFHPSFQVEEGQYGNAILSRFPIEIVRAGPLPSLNGRQQPRGALWVQAEVAGKPLQVVTTHLGLSTAERMLQVDALLGPDWLHDPGDRERLVLCGDMNILPGSRAYRRLARLFKDAQKSIDRYRPQRTWFAPFPLTRIDHVFVGERIRVKQIDIPRTALSRVASDHLPLVVDLEME